MTNDGHKPFIITEVYAAVSVAPDGDEGICGVQLGDKWVPLISADETRREWIKKVGAELGQTLGVRVRLVRLSTREDIEVLAEGRHHA